MERRRGKGLEEAILSAAWEELSATGYSSFTLESVAKRSETSRPVLARRWTSRADLALAAIAHYLRRHPVKIPNSGSLRDDLTTLLHLTSRRSYAVNGLLFSMRDYFTETGYSLADLRDRLAPDASGADAMQTIFRRGIERGEIDPRKLTKRIASLPMDLVRHDTLMLNRPASRGAVTEIVDMIFLPLTRPLNQDQSPDSRETHFSSSINQ
jgi:AcrR family transcriptional regulator